MHVQHRGRMVPFAGWEMPVQYEGIKAEHLAVRRSAGLFDVSHMGEVDVKGPQATAFVQNLITNNVHKIVQNQCLYSPMCYENAGIVDDLLVYKHDSEHYMLVINASNVEKDFSWMQKNNSVNAELKNISNETAQLAVQGPRALAILQTLTSANLESIKTFWFQMIELSGVRVLASRTGYTGEDGFELYFPPEHAKTVWNAIVNAGSSEGLQPTGLGARDSLRLEAGLMLYGNDIDENSTPFEAPLKWTVDLNTEFIGKKALQQNPPNKKLVGFELLEKAVARHGNPVVINGNEAGVVTSGGYSPLLEKSIGLAYVPVDHPETFQIRIRKEKDVEAKKCGYRFYKRKKKEIA
ncbi:glycine cleavage system aminomethyltransferase GcvT [Candidatus Micrarchaeota archaeon]|nr:glycine cleavage system aminomethyltransferase GcvT [Candidatus Micrarchaeota archaeon]